MIYKIKTTKEKVSRWIEEIKRNWGSYYNWEFSISGVTWRATFGLANYLHIDITDKPWLASWDMIEEKINEFFK